MSTTRVPAALRARVTRQARHRCGYCLTAEQVVGSPMEIDHLVPEAQGGLTEEGNLWLACSACNTFKGDRTTVLDPLTGEIVPLFNPRGRSPLYWLAGLCGHMRTARHEMPPL